MTPMIDVVFQLLIFFLFTLKIIEPEGDFNINMPLGRPAESSVTDAELQPLKVRMIAGEDGQLRSLLLNGRELGPTDPFKELNDEVHSVVQALQRVGPADVGEGADAQEVEIDPDYDLDYKYVISAVSACSGMMVDGTPVPLLKRIKFAPIHNRE